MIYFADKKLTTAAIVLSVD